VDLRRLNFSNFYEESNEQATGFDCDGE
jgi:hypothetical protein